MLNDRRFFLISKHPITGNACKTDCPNCGSKKRFSPYWDALKREIVQGAGKCDRVNGCGAHIRPRDVADFKASGVADYSRWLADRYGRNLSSPARVRAVPLNGLLSYWSDKYPDTAIKRWLTCLFGVNDVCDALAAYSVTGDGAGGVCFWQTDGRGNAITGRIIKYLPTGKRDRATNPDWAHAVAKRAGKLPEGYQPPKHLFGLGTMKEGADVLVMESEKSALLCWLLRKTQPDNGLLKKYNVFLATGGATFLETTTRTDAAILTAARSVTLCPDDDDAGETWEDTAARHGWGVDHIARITSVGGRGKGWDVGDAVLHWLRWQRSGAGPLPYIPMMPKIGPAVNAWKERQKELANNQNNAI